MLYYPIKFDKKKLDTLCEKKKELLEKLSEVDTAIKALATDFHLGTAQSSNVNHR